MAIKIQLTPSELLAQSTEMTSLQAEYESLFGNVTGVLTDINDSWSANLANNFLGKITSAQSAFTNLTGLLQQGAVAARTSANTLESVDSALAAAMAYDAGGGEPGGVSSSNGIGNSWDTPVGTINSMYYKTDGEINANWDVKHGDAGVGVKGTASFSLLQTSKKGQVGKASGEYEVKVGTVKGEGKATLNIMSSGELNPELELSVKAKAEGISGKIEGSYGSEDFNAHIKGEGAVGTAEAEAKIALSKDGLGGKMEVGAAALSGKVTTGFTVFGIKIDASIKGEVGAVGAGAEFGVTDSSFEVGGKLSFLAGLGLKIKVSW